jgi:cell division protein FtsI/penicillin-binding protein 2
MVKSGHLRRLFALAILMGAVLVALGGRLVVVQVFSHEKYRRIAEVNTQRIFLREPRRGDILDAHGHPLATSVPVKKVYADPSLIGLHYERVANVLAPLLNYAPRELAAMLRPELRTNEAGRVYTNQYVNLQRKLGEEQWLQVTQAMGTLTFAADEQKLPRLQRAFYRNLRRGAIGAADGQLRRYPAERLAAHVLGFTAENEELSNGYAVTEMAGRDGIERWMDGKLTGVRGWRVTETDNRRREIVAYREQEVEARPGLDVVLTIDTVIQNMVESELAETMKEHRPISAQAIVVRPRTGEILAMGQLPNYDPNQPGKSLPEEMRNRMIADMIEPGSTFKIVVVSAALNEHAVSLDDVFYCEHGSWRFMGRPLHDDHGGYGDLTVEGIITKSSNIGSAKIAVFKLGEQKLYDYMRAFGFGGRTGVTLPGELNGLVWPVPKWDKLMISRIPMGHSVAVTHMQMVMAMSALANHGRLMRPMLISRLQDANGNVFAQYHPQEVRQAISPETATKMVRALKTVTTKEGTAPKAALEHYTVAGKTGTARKVIGGQYVRDKHISSFIGFFPADNPEVCISVMLDEPHKGYYGGQTAAPIFKRIAEQIATYLKLRPDREPSDAVTGVLDGERLGTASLRGN